MGTDHTDPRYYTDPVFRVVAFAMARCYGGRMEPTREDVRRASIFLEVLATNGLTVSA